MRIVTVCLVLLSISTMAFAGLDGYKLAPDFTNTLRWKTGVGWTECQYDWLYSGPGGDGLRDNVGRYSVSSYDYDGLNTTGGIVYYDGTGYSGFSGIWPTNFTTGGNGLSSAAGFTVEYGGFALQGTTAGTGLFFAMYNNQTWPATWFRLNANNTLSWSGGSATVADVSQPHNYRMAILGDNGAGRLTMNIYQDATVVVANLDIGETPGTGVETDVSCWTATEWNSSANEEYTWQLDYIRYDTNGAWTPIPEPATMALLGLGGLFALIRRK